MITFLLELSYGLSQFVKARLISIDECLVDLFLSMRAPRVALYSYLYAFPRISYTNCHNPLYQTFPRRLLLGATKSGTIGCIISSAGAILARFLIGDAIVCTVGREDGLD